MKKHQVKLKCKKCGKYFYVQYYRRNNAKYCSIKCKLIGYRWELKTYRKIIKSLTKPEGHKSKNSYGYILIKNSKHPNRTKQNTILEHILIMSNFLKRPIKSGESIHHINFIRNDNRIKNLYLCSSISQHNKISTSLHKLTKFLLTKHIISFDRKRGEYIINENRI